MTGCWLKLTCALFKKLRTDYQYLKGEFIQKSEFLGSLEKVEDCNI